MIFFPAIDLKDGACVRLLRGDMDKATLFNDSPGDQARQFAAAQIKWLHVVDLNGAFEGKPVNASAVLEILANVTFPIQLGGGVRSMDDIEAWLDKGVARVILGTVALRDPELVKSACARHPGRIAIGIDAREGKVAVEGWARLSEMTAMDLARRFEDVGAAALIYTDIARDGAMEGPNLDATLALASAVSTPVILSGGVSSMADLEAIKLADQDGLLEGVISGRAVYDGLIEPQAAQKLLDRSP